MLTKNFYSFIRAALSTPNSTSADFTKTDGTTTSILFNNGYPPFRIMNVWAKGISQYGVSFGTGTTPATVSDYFLESILTDTQISVSTPSEVNFSRYDTYEEYTVTFGITNRTAEAISISEVGLTANPYRPSSGSNYVFAMVDRTVLDTPVTIPAGQSKQITYTIRFNYGDAV